MQISKRLQAIPPYVFAEIDKKRQAAIARGVDVINLGIGDPDQPTPRHIVEAMKQALDNPLNHRYPPFGGTKEYKEAAATWLKNRFGYDVDPNTEITSLIGSKEGIHNIIACFVDPGDIALIPDPAYPVYKSSTILCDGIPHYMPLLEKNEFRADLTAIPDEVAAKAKIMFLNYPNNPTAGVCDLNYLAQAVAMAKKHGFLLVHDLAYSEMTFDGYKAHSIFEVPGAKEVAIELHSLSKSFNMTGWRIGFAVGNPYAIKALAQLKSNIDTDVFKAIQMAAIAAFNGPRDEIERCNALYVERRNLAIEALGKLGFPVRPIKATFYMWLPVPKGMSSNEFSNVMLDEAGIVVPPGTAYGPCGEGYFRMSLCTDKERLMEAFERMHKCAITFDRGTVKA